MLARMFWNISGRWKVDFERKVSLNANSDGLWGGERRVRLFRESPATHSEISPDPFTKFSCGEDCWRQVQYGLGSNPSFHQHGAGAEVHLPVPLLLALPES